MTWSLAELAEVGDLAAALVEDRPAPAAPAALVRQHGLAPMAFTHGRTEFRHDHIMSSIRADQQRAIAIEAVAALAAHGIPVALLKGISYAGWLYADPADRPMTDVDLMVPADRHPEALRVLGRLGYRHTGIANHRSPRLIAMQLKRQHGSVDLHRGPVHQGRIAIDLDAVWRRVRPSSWIPGAQRLEVLDEALFHFAILARSELAVPLRTFVDTGRLLRHVDRAALFERADAWRFRRVLTLCLAVVEHLLGRAPAPPWWLPQRPEILRGDPPRRSAVQIGRKLMLVEGPRELFALARAVADGAIRARVGAAAGR